MENTNDWTSEKDVSCMYSLSQQDTSRDNRLNMLVESRVRREVQARFGGEFLETYRRNTARHRVLSLRLTAQYLVLFVAGLLGVFVCFAPYDDPEIAVAIVIEHATWGSNLATTGVDILNAYFTADETGSAVTGENQLLP